MENIALAVIITSGIIYITKNVINLIREVIFRKHVRSLLKQTQKMFEDLSSVPTKTKRRK